MAMWDGRALSPLLMPLCLPDVLVTNHHVLLLLVKLIHMSGHSIHSSGQDFVASQGLLILVTKICLQPFFALHTNKHASRLVP
jgi:hypothetical protein